MRNGALGTVNAFKCRSQGYRPLTKQAVKLPQTGIDMYTKPRSSFPPLPMPLPHGTETDDENRISVTILVTQGRCVPK